MNSRPTPQLLVRLTRATLKPTRKRPRSFRSRAFLALFLVVCAVLWAGVTHLPSLLEADLERPSGTVAESAVVARVIDGDTVELAGGTKVRLAGIDTPERGECGYDEATQSLVDQVEGERVDVVLTDEDTDRYGRLLAYLDLAEGIDTGLTQISSGLAIARYDSRDGYGPHPRERQYIEADDRASSICP